LQEFTQVIDQINGIPPIVFPVYAAFDSISGTPWYGVKQGYTQNPIGDLVDCGYFTETGRTGAGSVSLEYNLSSLIPGLKSNTDLAFNMYNLTRIGKAEQYAAYYVNPSLVEDANGDPVLDANGERQYDVNLAWQRNGTEMPDLAKLYDYYTQRMTFSQQLMYDRSFGVHDVKSNLTYYISKYLRNGVEEPMRQQNVLWTGSYTYKNKYSVQSAVNYSGSSSFAKGKRYKVFPTIGASWILLDENFMESTSSWLNFLKLRVEYGLTGYDGLLASRQYYMTVDRWTAATDGAAFGPHTSNRWFGTTIDTNGSYRTTYNRIGNPNLTWEVRKELSAGLDLLMLQNRLSLAVTYYNILRDDIITRIQSDYFPLTAGYMAYPFFNFEKTRNNGVELGLQYSDRVGYDFRYSIGGNAAYQNSNRIKVYELPFANSYQKRQGTPNDAYFGFVYLGRFQSNDEANQIPQLFDENLQQGDLKYADLNGDGVIDSNDQKQIGNTTPRLIYGLNLNLAYKQFDLTVVANGRAFVDLPLTTEYYQNGWLDGNYSKFVLDNMDGKGEYPRLTYNKVNNNFLGSAFWLRNGAYFKIQNVELGFNMKVNPANKLALRGARFFARGANLLTISEIKDCDPESLQSGVLLYPLYRTFTGGVKLMF
jgi:TonB-linked SusC/RagA family outer membrane protein